MLLLLIVYISLLVFGLERVGIWNASNHLKDTIVWAATVALVMFFNISDASKETFFQDKLKDAIKFTVVLEFVIGFYPFGLPVELVLVPIIMFLIMMKVVAESNQKYSEVKKVFDWLLTLVGLLLLWQAMRGLLADTNNFVNTERLVELILPSVLTVLFLPFVYLVALYAAYDILFVRLKFFNHDSKLLGYAKRRIFLRFGFNLRKLNKWSKQNANLRVSSKDEVFELISGAVKPTPSQ